MGSVVKDFYKSDAPQFQGKSKEKRREMAVAAKLTAERGPQNESATEKPMTPQELALQKRKAQIDKMITMKRQQALQKTQKKDVKEEIGLDERTRYAKETGKDPQTGKPSEKGGTRTGKTAFDYVRANIKKTGGLMSDRGKAIQPQGKKKVKGAKGYKGVTPVDKIKGKLARKRAPKPEIGSRFD